MVRSRTLFRLEDLLKKTKIENYYSKFSLLCKSDPEEIRILQKEKLRLLIRHSYSNIPWYRRKMNEAGINPEDIIDLKSIINLPVLTRNDIRDFSDQMKWQQYTGKILHSSSSGTTGIPIKYSQDVNAFSAGIAAGHTLMGLSGWKPGMRNVHIWGNMDSIKQWKKLSSQIKQILYKRKNIASPLINNPEQILPVVKKIIKFKPYVIDGYTNSIYELANYLKANRIRLNDVKMVFTTGENLEEFHKKLIEEIIAPVSDIYGCGEINGIACRPAGDARYYIFDPHVLVETLQEKDSLMKEILITDLDNFYMPFIRYKVGDIIDTIKPASKENIIPFSYFTRIYGRTADHIVLPDGKKLFPINIFGGTVYRKYLSVTRHKTIWNGKKLIFLFETKDNPDIQALKSEIDLSLKEYNVEYEVKFTDKILPGKSGKHQYFERI